MAPREWRRRRLQAMVIGGVGEEVEEVDGEEF